MQGHGLNLFTDTIEDTFSAGIIEPLKVKTQAISSASEVAMMILRIDDVLVSRRSGEIPRQGYSGLSKMNVLTPPEMAGYLCRYYDTKVVPL